LIKEYGNLISQKEEKEWFVDERWRYHPRDKKGMNRLSMDEVKEDIIR